MAGDRKVSNAVAGVTLEIVKRECPKLFDLALELYGKPIPSGNTNPLRPCIIRRWYGQPDGDVVVMVGTVVQKKYTSSIEFDCGYDVNGCHNTIFLNLLDFVYEVRLPYLDQLRHFVRWRGADKMTVCEKLDTIEGLVNEVCEMHEHWTPTLPIQQCIRMNEILAEYVRKLKNCRQGRREEGVALWVEAAVRLDKAMRAIVYE